MEEPLLLLLVFAAIASALTGQWMDAAIVLTIVVTTVVIGYTREYSAQTAAAALRTRLSLRTVALRDRQPVQVPTHDIFPGDVVLLAAGSLVPADGVILEAADFYVSEAVLTGESFPVRKTAGTREATAGLGERTNCVFLGTNVRSGTARCLIVRTGSATGFGTIAHRLTLRAPETEFDRGVRRFGYLMTGAMLIMVLLVFVAHMFRGRTPVDTLFFSIALAVGLSPELLPAILSVNLARGAELMSRRGVLVRRLSAIENLGSMNILCTDKTGTLTEGVVQVEGAYDAAGRSSADALELAAWNAALESGVSSPLDDAIVSTHRPDVTAASKLAEVPFDFTRKRVTVVVQKSDGARLITKGAFHHVLEICTQLADGSALDEAAGAQLEQRYQAWTSRGIRVLAVAARCAGPQASDGRDDECGMRFMGFITFLDRPREGVREALQQLTALGVAVKLITGDSGLVAKHVASLVGMRAERILSGRDLAALHDEALWSVAEKTDLFVEVDPNQKVGLVSAMFDFVTFAVLQVGFHGTPDLFRTAWFVESLLTELVVALVVRTGRPFYQSRPGRVLLTTTVALIGVAVAIPFLPFADVFGFVPLPPRLVAAIAGITVLYVAATEVTKRRVSVVWSAADCATPADAG